MPDRSRANSLLANTTIASPALIGFSLGLYEANSFSQNYELGGVPFPQVVPGPVSGFEMDLLNRAMEVPGLSWLGEIVLTKDIYLGVAFFSAMVWTLLLLVPLVAWGVYCGWWTDSALAQRGERVRQVAWLVATPGLVLGVLAIIASAVLLIVVAIAAAIAWAALRNERLPATAIDGTGAVFKRERDGNYKAVAGTFGQKHEVNVIGQAETEKQFGSPKVVRRNPFAPTETGSGGQKLYVRKEKDDVKRF